MKNNNLEIEDFMSIKLTDSDINNVSEYFLNNYHECEDCELDVYSKIVIKFKDYESFCDFENEDIYTCAHCSDSNEEKLEVYVYSIDDSCFHDICEISSNYDVDIYQLKVENVHTDFDLSRKENLYTEIIEFCINNNLDLVDKLNQLNNKKLC